MRCSQVFIRGWDQHGNLTGDMPLQCGDVDRASYALVQDLKMRGMLDDTLIILGRRVWANDLLPGRSQQNQLRPRSPSALLQHVAGGWGCERRDRSRPDRRFLLQHRQ